MSKEIDDNMDDVPLSKSFTIRGKKEEEKGKKSRVKCEGRTLSISTSPKNLMTVMRTLRPLQKKWVEEIGLGSILDLDVDTIPSRLAFGIVNAFDSEGMVIRTFNGDIEVNNESVNRILGLKNEGLDIKAFATGESWDNRIESWKAQFDDRSCIRAFEIQKKITQSESDDWIFRLNFIILFINSMAESSKMGIVNSTILSHLPNELDFKMINWCKYICDCARDAKNAWSSKVAISFYTRPITFFNDKGKAIFVEQQQDNATEGEEEGNLNEEDVVETSCQNNQMDYDDIATSIISNVVVDINQISKQLAEEEEENENEKMDQGFTEKHKEAERKKDGLEEEKRKKVEKIQKEDEEKRNKLQKKNEEEEKRKKDKEQEEIELHKKQQEEPELNRRQLEKEIEMKKKLEEENRRKLEKQKENEPEKEMEKDKGDGTKKTKLIINFKKAKIDAVEDKGKRIQTLSDVVKSPFFIRTMGINSKPNANDCRFANIVFALQGKKDDILFETKEEDKCSRYMMGSMIPESEVYYNPGEMFQEHSTDERRIELFWTNLCAFMDKYSSMDELKKTQLKGSFHILDNSAVDVPNSAKYGKVPMIVKKVFLKTLNFIDDGRAKKLSKAKQKRENMLWRTTGNKIDCGIFVMRHMETFMGGNVSKWDSGFAIGEDAQKNQIENLRYKYVAVKYKCQHRFC
ncbi:hypothetical protein OSB04_015902 [Centaurea solstitialis]|uniref:Ubiquitin-like protease family profile domain-containing protein n=1 Tax=Centaurea solstitialis TaxID=347529 RepID=A0AA38W7Y4_9ASTR|nr:hypothetical protein OSB04_015902 [Centaurea solstitialis]